MNSTKGADDSLTCRAVTEMLSDYVSGELTAEPRASVDRHVAACVYCANYLAAYQKTLTLTTDAFDASEDTRVAVPEALVNAILEARRQ